MRKCIFLQVYSDDSIRIVPARIGTRKSVAAAYNYGILCSYKISFFANSDRTSNFFLRFWFENVQIIMDLVLWDIFHFELLFSCIFWCQPNQIRGINCRDMDKNVTVSIAHDSGQNHEIATYVTFFFNQFSDNHSNV